MQSSKASARSSTPAFLFLDLRASRGGGFCGPTPEQSWETVTHWLGAQWMPSIGEFPNVESASHLSSILQANVPERYYLSQKACEGILRRASRRGKQLPETLKRALLEQIKAPPVIHPENPFRMRGRRQGRTGAD